MICPECGCDYAKSRPACPECGAPVGTEPRGRGCRPQGCVSAAWDDINATGGWLGRFALAGLLMLVPVARYVAVGYLLHWGGLAARGDDGPMPRRVLSATSAIDGLRWLVATAAPQAVTAACAWGLSSSMTALGRPEPPLLAAEAAALAVVAVCMLCLGNVMALRASALGRVSAAFSLPSIARAVAGSPGAVLSASVAPALIVGIPLALVMLPVAVVLLLASSGPSLVVAALAFPMAFAGALSAAWTFRALGHWAFRRGADRAARTASWDSDDPSLGQAGA